MVDKNAHYLMCKGGVFYFTRHVPNDLQRHYETTRIVICLKTRNRTSAMNASRSMAAKLDDFWLQMRLSHLDVPASDDTLSYTTILKLKVIPHTFEELMGYWLMCFNDAVS